MYITKTFYHI